MGQKLSEKVIERLSQYRQILIKYQYASSPHINSADLARVLKISEENVRRDFMLIGCRSTSLRKGFNIRELVNSIDKILSYEDLRTVNVAIIGENSCITEFLLNDCSENRFHIAGIFNFSFQESEPGNKTGHYNISQLPSIIEEKNILIGVINMAPDYVEQIAEILINLGIKGIINISPVKLKVPGEIYLEEINPITLLDKALYYIKNKTNGI